MKARRFITQFYRILPTRAVDKKYIHKKTSKKLYEFDESRPNLNEHYVHPLKAIVWHGPYGRVLLYAVRAIDTYMVSINGRSKLYPKASDIYKALVGKKVFPDSEKLSELFSNYRMISLDDIVVLSNLECEAAALESTAELIELSPYEWIIKEEDLHVEHFGRTTMHSYIPCLYEDKIVIELFLETSTITDEMRLALKGEGFKEFISSYTLTCEAVSELIEDLGIYF